jgi:hypothetical protein
MTYGILIGIPEMKWLLLWLGQLQSNCLDELTVSRSVSFLVMTAETTNLQSYHDRRKAFIRCVYVDHEGYGSYRPFY